MIDFRITIFICILALPKGVLALQPLIPIAKITKPIPESTDRFGEQVVGFDDVIAISARDDNTFAEDGGAVYLFGRGGEFLRVIGSPAAQDDGEFGAYLARVGTDRLLVGADREEDFSGNAYLFDLNGKLLKTFNGTTDASFGGRFFASTDDAIFIAAWRDESVPGKRGVVYKYDHDGEFIGTLVSPRDHPDLGCFGREGVLVGNDKILISDACDASSGSFEAGAAFLFDLDGTLRAEYDNPLPMSRDGFGTGLAWVGDQILIGGAQIDDLDTGLSTGAAYIFETTGELVTRVSDPEPRSGNWFGWNASKYEYDSGETRFIVGSVFNSTEFFRAGRAFLLNEDGEVTQVLSSPEPGIREQFGSSFAQIGNQLLIGETNDDGGFPDGKGAVWIFAPAELGDFDLNGEVNLLDLDSLCSGLSSGGLETTFDLTGDDLIDGADLQEFLSLTGIKPGDADFDGVVDFDDFLSLSANFGSADAPTWSDGNFDCDSHVAFSDFLQLSQNFGTSPTDAATVPEPQPPTWLLVVLMVVFRSANTRNTLVLKAKQRPTCADWVSTTNYTNHTNK